jgi:phosphoenolpyruvate carboxykinase (ATP)
MLTADAFGVMPPIAKLTPAQAMYHFLSGYTAKVAGTEKGVTEPEATFSTCFGAPFMPRHPSVYGNLLRDLIARHERRLLAGQHRLDRRRLRRRAAACRSRRRARCSAALDGSLREVEFRTDPHFGFAVPVSVPGVDDSILDPRSTWADPPPMTARRPGWSACSSTISPSSRSMWTAPC